MQGLGFFSLHSSTVGRRREAKVEGDSAQRSQVPGMSAVAAGGQLGIGRYPWSSSAVAALNSLQRGDDP